MRFRKGLVSVALERARRLDLGWFLDQAGKYLAIRRAVHRRDGRTGAGPIIAHFFCTHLCNLRCPMCDIPGRTAAAELTTEKALRLIDELKGLPVSGLAFTGGEPLLRPDIFELIERSRSHDLDTLLVTNGLLIDKHLDNILKAGPDIINISIDGSTPAIHDKSRGKTGVFEKITANIQSLTRAVKQKKAAVRIVASTVISKNNINDIGNIISLCRSMGMSRVILCPIHEFSPGKCRVTLMDSPFDLSSYLMNHPDRAIIDNSDRYLGFLNTVLKGEAPPAGCCAGYTTLIIDFEGRIYPCKCYFETGRPLAHWTAGGADLKSLWHSEAFNAFRRSCGGCRECYLTLNREFDTLFT